MDCHDKSLSYLYCSNVGMAPTFALVVSGVARSFIQPIVYRSFRENIIDALGLKIISFARLKLNDINWKSDHVYERFTLQNDVEKIQNAISHLGISPSNVKIINNTDITFANCTKYSSFHKNYSKIRNMRPSYLYAFLGQLESRFEGIQMVRHYENKNDILFKWVLYSRADALWYRPLRPWCFFLSEKVSEKIMYHRHDFAFLIPRITTFNLFEKPYKDYYACAADLPQGKLVEHWQRGEWRKNELYPDPIVDTDSTLPVMIMRQYKWLYSRHEFGCKDQMITPERYFQWEPNLLRDTHLCTKITFENKCAS